MERIKRATREAAGKTPESGFVTVACKMPNGLVLQVWDIENYQEPMPGGMMRDATRRVKCKKFAPITLNPARRRMMEEEPSYRIIGGYAMTENVPAELWSRWLRDNQDSDIVKNGLICAFEKADSSVSEAKNRRDVRSGLEPVSQTKDPRMPKKIKPADMTNKDLENA